MASDTEVNQEDMVAGCQHDVGGFEVAEDNRWLARVQVVEHRAELYADIEYFLNWQLASHFVQVRFQGFALDVIHDEVPAAGVVKLFIDARQVGMGQAGEEEGFAFESFDGFGEFS